jgi:hypothetical protein
VALFCYEIVTGRRSKDGQRVIKKKYLKRHDAAEDFIRKLEEESDG